MTDWKAAVAAIAPDVPAEAVERAAGVLATLDERFRPLVAQIPIETQPASLFLTPEEPR